MSYFNEFFRKRTVTIEPGKIHTITKNDTVMKTDAIKLIDTAMKIDTIKLNDAAMRNDTVKPNNAVMKTEAAETASSHIAQSSSTQNKKADRRVLRTRALLRQGLTQLMAEKEIKDITVKELCDLAGVTRGTFYLHYSDIYDILRHMEYEIFVEFNDILNHSPVPDIQKSVPEAILTDIFSLLERHRDMVRVMMGAHGDPAFVDHLKNLVKMHIYQVLTRKNTGCEHGYAEAFAVSGCIGVIETWLYHPAPLPPREIARICCDMLVQGLDLT